MRVKKHMAEMCGQIQKALVLENLSAALSSGMVDGARASSFSHILSPREPMQRTTRMFCWFKGSTIARVETPKTGHGNISRISHDIEKMIGCLNAQPDETRALRKRVTAIVLECGSRLQDTKKSMSTSVVCA